MRHAVLLVLLIQIVTFAAERDAFLVGVKDIVAPGAPGAICVFGPEAFAVVNGKEGELQQPVIAAGKLGNGRIVLFGHDAYFDDKNANVMDTARLLQNAIAWSARRDSVKKLNVGLVSSRMGRLFTQVLNQESGGALLPLDWKPLPPGKDPFDFATKLSKVEAVIVDAETFNDVKNAKALLDFVQNGGGLLCAETPWGWASTRKKSLVTDLPANAFFARAGLVFADGTPDKTKGEYYDTTLPIDEHTNASVALERLQKPYDSKEKGAKRAVAQSSSTLVHALRSLPPGESLLLPKIEALIQKHGAQKLPTPQAALKQIEHAVDRLILAKQLIDLERAPMEKITAHPAAAHFPGAIAADVPRVTKELVLDARIPEWHSTGLYAAPGEKITVRIPADAIKERFALRIGAHRDGLWHLDSWRRAPEITRQWTLTQAETVVASPFGGPVYIVAPFGNPRAEFNVSIAGALEAPRYTLGKTSAEEWKTIRARAAPWAEMETRTVVFTVPSEFIRTLDDPEPVMKFWASFMDATADLAAISRNRLRPERYVADTQISAGFMHSGYPIMMHYNEGKPCMELNHLMTQDEPTWGYFHEMGHNHQKSDWTFGGTTEVTCNLFARYAFETLCKRPLADQRGHKNGDFEKNFRRYLAAGADFDKWKADPFLALYMYDQLYVAFGWDTYKKVFTEYNALPGPERPKSEEQKRDQWMVRFSRACGKNLGPFFQAWGVPTSDAARKSIAELPAWMPANWPANAQ